MNNECTRKYHNYCRPRLAELLESVRLDKVYYRGEKDYLYYKENDKDFKILDFLGGYGASLFGHNNPDLVNIARSNLDNQVPFNTQASCRSTAASLAEKLNEMMERTTGRNFYVTLANSGTEAIEAAIKHAELAHFNSIEKIHEEFSKQRTILKRMYENGEVTISPSLLTVIQEDLGVPPHGDIQRHMIAVRNHNYRVFRKRPIFLSLKRSFHGKTSGSVQLTHYEEYRTPFSRIGINTIFLEPGDKEEMEDALGKSLFHYYWPQVNEDNEIYLEKRSHYNISALFIEPIQGEGGIRIIPKEILQYYRKICDTYDIPLVFDEIQSGMGRTGTFLYSEQNGVVADYYTMSKSLGGGLAKISAMMVQRDKYDEEFGFIHTSTFAEDDMSSSIALGALELLENDTSIMDNCIKRGNYLKKGLKKIQEKFPDVIEEIRGAGLMLGIQFTNLEGSPSAAFRMLSEQKLFGYVVAGFLLHEQQVRVAPTLSNSATIRLEPSAYISEEDCDRLISAIKRLSEIIYKLNVYELTKFIVGAEQPLSTHEIKDYRRDFVLEKTQKYGRKVAFIGHFIQARDIRLFDEGFTEFTDEQCEVFQEKVFRQIDPQIYERINVRSLTGESVNLNFIAMIENSNIVSRHMVQNNLAPLHEKIEKAVDIAIENGCQVMGFGGFTSIVTGNCQSIINDSIGLTTGNSFTVAMGLMAVYKAAVQMEIDLSSACLAAVGAGGNICSVYSEIIAEKIPRIILIGRKGKEERMKDVASEIYFSAFNEIIGHLSNLPDGMETQIDSRIKKDLQGVAREICDTEAVKKLLKEFTSVDRIGRWLYDHLTNEMKDRVPVTFTDDINEIKKANVIVSASNSPDPIIYSEMLGDGPIIINDIAVPNDVDETVHNSRNDVLVFQGGVVKLPYNPEFRVGGIPLDPGTSFACMAETILLGLTGITDHYSYGRIHKIQVKKIMEIAKIHGFSLGRFKTERSF